jgi:hypothetical protein
MGASRRSDTARAALDHVAAAQPTVSTATLAPGTDAGALFALRGDHVGWATVWLVAGPPTGQLTARFVDRVIRLWRSHGYPVRAVGTDNRPEYVAAGFRATLAAKGINHGGSRPAQPTTTPSSNASAAPSSKSAGGPPSTAAGSTRSPPAPSRGQLVADHLQPPATQPQRLHGRTHPRPNPRRPPQKQDSMNLNHRAHLSLRTPARKH